MKLPTIPPRLTGKIVKNRPLASLEKNNYRYLKPKGLFFVLRVGFPIAKFLFSIKKWGKKVKLGQFYLS